MGTDCKHDSAKRNQQDLPEIIQKYLVRSHKNYNSSKQDFSKNIDIQYHMAVPKNITQPIPTQQIYASQNFNNIPKRHKYSNSLKIN
jgi:hypothetical protein